MAPVEAAEVLSALTSGDLDLPRGCHIELIKHNVGLNWRQRYATPRSRVLALKESLVHEGPFEGQLVEAGVLGALLAELKSTGTSGTALSVTSRIWSRERRFVGHLALMNLHPEGFGSFTELADAVREVSGGHAGYLLYSGRFFHYYGRQLLAEDEWPRFMGEFLMPCNLVSPRYIGHSLNRGFCALRLNAVSPQKPVAPRLICAV
jgi:hypothetical protein